MGLGNGLKKAAGFLADEFANSIEKPPLRDLLQQDGLLHFERRFLKNDEYRMRYDDKSKALIGDLAIPKDDSSLFDIITSGQIRATCAFMVRDSKCSKCDSPYHHCNCSKYVDKEVVQIMSDVPLLGLFWTNRMA